MAQGFYTFLFSDIQGSTRLWETFPSLMDGVISRHDELVHGAVRGAGGEVYKHTGDGMGAVFSTPSAAVDASVQAQRALISEDWGPIGILKVRMGVHSGEADERDGYYFGSCLNHVSRLMSAANGGQTLVSRTSALGCTDLPPQISLADLGVHRLRDLSRADNIFQVRHPDLPDDFPPIQSEKTGNLPEPPHELLGRETELEQLSAYLADSRLITLVGFGGSGKTRLSVELGRRSVNQFQDGAWFFGMASIADPQILSREFASLFGVAEDSLDSYISDKQMLIIVDNCEHLLAGAASLVQRLLSFPGIRVVATSREPLNLAGERSFEISPLTVPDGHLDVSVLAEYPAVQLFVQRAQAAQPNFWLSEDNGASIRRIVERLDGIPLAIELAASRVKLLQPAEIANRLEDSFKLLSGGPINALPHHQTLERAIDWSYDMLDSEQQTMFRQLSVFRGGFTLEAFGAIRGEEDEFENLDSVAQLVDKSIVRADHSGEETRYHLLEPLRQYASAKSSDGELADWNRRHALYFQRLAQSAEPELRGPRQHEWLDRLETEHDNLRLALAWSVDSDNPDIGLYTASSLTWFWLVRRHVSEALTWFDWVLESGDGSSHALASALIQAGFVKAVVRQNDLEGCREQILGGLELFLEIEDGQGIGTAQTYDAVISWHQRNFDDANRKLVEIQAAMRSSGFAWGDAFCDWFLGSSNWFAGDMGSAHQHYTRGLQVFKEIGDMTLIAWSLLPLGNIALGSGDTDAAMKFYDQCLPMMSDIGDRLGVGTVMLGMGIAADARSDHEQAARLITDAQAHLREGSGDGQGLSWSISNAPVDTSTRDLLVSVTSRYQSGLNLPSDEWVRMVLADGETRLKMIEQV